MLLWEGNVYPRLKTDPTCGISMLSPKSYFASSLRSSFQQTQVDLQRASLPANSVMIPNHWAMTREQEVSGPNMDIFRPERFLANEKLPIVGVVSQEVSVAVAMSLGTVYGFLTPDCCGRSIFYQFNLRDQPVDSNKDTNGLVTKHSLSKLAFKTGTSLHRILHGGITIHMQWISLRCSK